MRALIFIALVLLLTGCIVSGVIYFSSDPNKASVNFDKNRAAQVKDDMVGAGQRIGREIDESVGELQPDLNNPPPRSPERPINP